MALFQKNIFLRTILFLYGFGVVALSVFGYISGKSQMNMYTSSDKIDLYHGSFFDQVQYMFSQFGLLGLFRQELLISCFNSIFGGEIADVALWVVFGGIFLFGVFKLSQEFFSKISPYLSVFIFGIVFLLTPFLFSVEWGFSFSVFPLFVFLLARFLHQNKPLPFLMFLILFVALLSQGIVSGLLLLLFAFVCIDFFAHELLSSIVFTKLHQLYVFIGGVFLFASWLIAGEHFSRIVFDEFSLVAFDSTFSLVGVLILVFFLVLFVFIFDKKYRKTIYLIIFLCLFSASYVDAGAVLGDLLIPLPGAILKEIGFEYVQVIVRFCVIFCLSFLAVIGLCRVQKKYTVVYVISLLLFLSFGFFGFWWNLDERNNIELDGNFVVLDDGIFDASIIFDNLDGYRFDTSFDLQVYGDGVGDFMFESYLHKLRSKGVRYIVFEDEVFLDLFQDIGFVRNGGYYVVDISHVPAGIFSDVEISYSRFGSGKISKIDFDIVEPVDSSVRLVLSSSYETLLGVYVNGVLESTFLVSDLEREFYILPELLAKGHVELRVYENQVVDDFVVSDISYDKSISGDIFDLPSALDASGYADLQSAENADHFSLSSYSDEFFMRSLVGLNTSADFDVFDPEYFSFLVSQKSAGMNYVLPREDLHPVAWNRINRFLNSVGAQAELLDERGLYGLYAISFLDIGREYLNEVYYTEAENYFTVPSVGFVHFAACVRDDDFLLLKIDEKEVDIRNFCGFDSYAIGEGSKVEFILHDDNLNSSFGNVSFSANESLSPFVLTEKDVSVTDFFARSAYQGESILLEVPAPLVEVRDFPMAQKAVVTFDMRVPDFYKGGSDVAFGFASAHGLTSFNNLYPELQLSSNAPDALQFNSGSNRVDLDVDLFTNDTKRVTLSFDRGLAVVVVDGEEVHRSFIDDSFVQSFAFIAQGCCRESSFEAIIENISYEIET